MVWWNWHEMGRTPGLFIRSGPDILGIVQEQYRLQMTARLED
jgi:hypothetical protein